jgi:hypothetical protein
MSIGLGTSRRPAAVRAGLLVLVLLAAWPGPAEAG